MKRFVKISGVKILLLAFSFVINYSALAQFAFNIPNRMNERIETYSSMMIAVEGKLALCSHSDKGSVFLNVTGGVSPYNFKWNTGENTQVRTNLNAGTYTVQITDSEGLEITQSIVIQAPFPLILDPVEKKDATCGSAKDGSAKIGVKVGRNDYDADRPPYRITWSNGLKDVWEAEGLPPGTYVVIVSDLYGCDASTSFEIKAASEGIEISESIQEVNCGATESGQIVLTVTGGKAPYTYSWSNGAKSKDLTNLSAGSYAVTINDAAGCTSAKQFSLSNSSALSLEVLENHPTTCSGEPDGELSLKLSGAKGIHFVTWSDGVKELLHRKNLSAGTYTIEVMDESGCATQLTVSVAGTATIQAKIETALDVNCATGQTAGVAWVSIQGGKAPFTIQWNSSGSNSREINFNSAGMLKVSVTDALGCSVVSEAKVDFPNQSTQEARLDFNYRKLVITSEPEVLVQEQILFESEIAADIIAWEWEFGDGNKSTEKDPVHIFTTSGVYEVKLTGYDMYGCSTFESNIVKVNSPAELVVVPNAFSPNGDKLNDTFKPKLLGVSSFQLEVFNAWGEKLYATDSHENVGWDGTFKGQLVSDGNYLFQISYITLSGQSARSTGGITLIR